ncbi:MAG: cytochrome c3 family protein [Planctomycetota bacterium]|jgi:predicted CXXCH cytochrome family protein
MKLRKFIFFIAVVAMAMSTQLWAAHTDGGCAGCHAAHNASDPNSPYAGDPGIPLWQGVIASPGAFTPYWSTSLDALDVGQPDGDSLVCLGCHDGTTQLPSDTGIDAEARFDLGQDLRDDHPISFVYTDALPDDADLEDPGASSGLGGTITADMLDSNNKMQCTSCHDVHAQHTDMALRKNNDTGQLCKTCHLK